ncbi:MAG: hypothetical protein IIB33_02700 [Chloroflexi bacterium]|nr:hypothetical protein [Chloroflexota bacterium]
MAPAAAGIDRIDLRAIIEENAQARAELIEAIERMASLSPSLPASMPRRVFLF